MEVKVAVGSFIWVKVNCNDEMGHMIDYNTASLACKETPLLSRNF